MQMQKSFYNFLIFYIIEIQIADIFSTTVFTKFNPENLTCSD